jgi:hypothetical protein
MFEICKSGSDKKRQFLIGKSVSQTDGDNLGISMESVPLYALIISKSNETVQN